MLAKWGRTMQVAIIGNGQVGSALSGALARAGHRVTFGLRKPQGENERPIADAVAAADAIILAVPFAAVKDVAEATEGFAGKIVIDATNPLGMRDDGLGLTQGFTTSGAEQIAALLPKAKVFKAFNQTGFENMADARAYASRPVMFVAGDDAESKPLVLALVGDAGFEAIDLGNLSKARLLEPLAMLWIELARKRGFGPHFSFTLERKV
jgi:predicted dinucleotide-binding enzyme